jgi:hypothetical protein
MQTGLADGEDRFLKNHMDFSLNQICISGQHL